MLSRQNYVKVAEIIANNDGDIDDLVFTLARYFKNDNPRFDVVRFLVAAGWLESAAVETWRNWALVSR